MDIRAKALASQIKELVDQLVEMTDSRPTHTKMTRSQKIKGASGCINILIEEGFFDTPKDIATVIARMKEIGRYYPTPTIGMNLLNFTKRRIMNRLKDKKSENWKYVLRK